MHIYGVFAVSILVAGFENGNFFCLTISLDNVLLENEQTFVDRVQFQSIDRYLTFCKLNFFDCLVSGQLQFDCLDDGSLLNSIALDQIVPNIISPIQPSSVQLGLQIDHYSRKVFVGGLPPDIAEGKTTALLWSTAKYL